jgi:hypothetical protein
LLTAAYMARDTAAVRIAQCQHGNPSALLVPIGPSAHL